MNKLNNIWKSIKKFFYGLTKAGQDEQYYEEARKNMQGPEAMKMFQTRVLQYDINNFLNERKHIRILTEDQKIALVKDKFKKDMETLQLSFCSETRKLIGA